MIQRNKTLLSWITFYLFMVFYLFWPFLVSPSLSLVDDGYSLSKGRALVTDFSLKNWQSTLIESDIGRFRPAYLFFYSILYLLYGHHPIGLWFFQAITVWLTTIILVLVTRELNGKHWSAYFLPVVWIMAPTVFENIFRLGPTEPRQLLFSLLSLLFWIKYRKSKMLSNLLAGFVFFIVAVGTKETSLLFLIFPISIFFEKLIILKKWWTLTFIGLGCLIFLALTVFISIKFVFPDGYVANNISFSPSILKIKIFQSRYNFAHYYLILWVVVVSFLTRGFNSWSERKLFSFIKDNYHVLVWYLLIIASLFFTIIWSFQFERYMYLSWSLIIILFFTEISKWINMDYKYLLERKKRQKLSHLTPIILIVGSVIGFVVGLDARGLNYSEIYFNNSEIYKRTFDINQVENSIIQFLLKDTQSQVLYSTNDNYEAIYELGLYLSQLKARQVIVYSPSQELANDQKHYYFSNNPIQDYANDQNPNKILVGRVIDLKGADLPEGAAILQVSQKYNKIGHEQYWWYLVEKNEREDK